ncbi:hypothetical protein Sjap_014822 [Stephania japonica]|uniref:Uncharacterized protein n=1 Tax=Stephania japonica TaxID=461633 RepID=A0AAP0IIS8_9MAGN
MVQPGGKQAATVEAKKGEGEYMLREKREREVEETHLGVSSGWWRCHFHGGWRSS